MKSVMNCEDIKILDIDSVKLVDCKLPKEFKFRFKDKDIFNDDCIERATKAFSDHIKNNSK